MFLIKLVDSVVLVSLPATFFSLFVDIDWEFSSIAVSVSFSNGITIPVLFHSDGSSTKAVIVLVAIVGILRALSVRTTWGLSFFFCSERFCIALSSGGIE